MHKLTRKLLEDLQLKLDNEKISMRSFAKEIGVHFKTVYLWFDPNGTKNVRRKTFKKINTFVYGDPHGLELEDDHPDDIYIVEDPKLIELIEFLKTIEDEKERHAAADKLLAIYKMMDS